MIGAGAKALCREISVTFRAPRPHERRTMPPGSRVIVAIAHTPAGPEEQPWCVPCRDAKKALNPRRRDMARSLAAGHAPPGWQRV